MQGDFRDPDKSFILHTQATLLCDSQNVNRKWRLNSAFELGLSLTLCRMFS